MSSPSRSPGHVAVRDARAEELVAIGELTVRVYADEGYLDDEPSYARVLGDAAGRAAAGRVLVADDGDGLVGAVALFLAGAGPEWAERAAPGEAVIRMLVVDPAARGRGVGEALTLGCLEAARAAGCHSVLLSSRPMMTAAHRLYARMGFRRVPGSDWEPAPGIDLLAFRYDL